MCVCVCEKNKLQYALKSATFSTLVACHGLPQISLHSKLPFHRLIRLRHRWWRLSLSPKLDNAPKLCFASPKAVWTYMSVFIGKNVDKPLDLGVSGVSYFQTKPLAGTFWSWDSWCFFAVPFPVRLCLFGCPLAWDSIGIEDKELNSESMQAWNKLSLLSLLSLLSFAIICYH